MVVCLVWFLQIILSARSENNTVHQALVSPPWSLHGSAVWHVSVPEHHHLCLPCAPHSHPTLKNQDVPLRMTFTWTHGGQEVPPKRTQDQDEDQDQWRFNIRPEGALCILRLVSSDSGEYHCNKQLMVDLQVLKGEVYYIWAGRTLLLPCTASLKPRQRWIRRRPGFKRELIMTRSRDGTVTLEREDARLGFEHDALRIVPLLIEDSGEYQCNREKMATVIVQTETNPTSTHQNHSRSVTPIFEETDFETNTKEKKSENVLLMVVMCLSLMVVTVTVVGVALISVKCRRRRRRRKATESPETTELQPWTTTPKRDEKRERTCPTPEEEEEEEEEIHYASLGRPTWNHRPIQTTPEREHHTVIYSSICKK